MVEDSRTVRFQYARDVGDGRFSRRDVEGEGRQTRQDKAAAANRLIIQKIFAADFDINVRDSETDPLELQTDRLWLILGQHVLAVQAGRVSLILRPCIPVHQYRIKILIQNLRYGSWTSAGKRLKA
eukprot:757936-Hanusia_phi.AAC.3